MYMDRNAVKLWRQRWADMATELEQTEKENPKALKQLIHDTISDAHRPGRPRDFSEVQVAEIIALACELPESKGLPFRHWTPGTLAEQAKKGGTVKGMPVRHLPRA